MRPLSRYWGYRDLSRLEVCVAIIVLLCLIGIFIHYALSMFAMAEQGLFQRTVRHINTVLAYHNGLIARQQPGYVPLHDIRGLNPMDYMWSPSLARQLRGSSAAQQQALFAVGHRLATPANYGGEVSDSSDTTLERGKWYFLHDRRQLIYIIRYNFPPFSHDTFAHHEGVIRFRIGVDYVDRDQNGAYSVGLDPIKSIRLQQIHHMPLNRGYER